MDWKSLNTSILVLLFALHITAGLVFPIWAYFFAFSSSIIVGIGLGVYIFWLRHKDLVKRWDSTSRSTAVKIGITSQSPISRETFKPRMLISKNADIIIEEIVDNLLRDYVMSFYKTIVHDDKHNIQTKLKMELWVIVSKFLTRLRSFEESFLEKDFVNLFTKHLRTVNDCMYKKEKYVLFAHLRTDESEKIFINRISDVLLDILAPSSYLSVLVLKNLIQEILTNHVIFKAISRLSDPDFINQSLLNYLSGMEQEARRTRKTKYAYAETYDKFIDMIKHTSDVQELKRMRTYIMTEIMQASAINHLKHQRGLDVERDKNVRGSSVKGDLLLARNLPRYMNQLRFAKKICDKRIRLLAPSEAVEASLFKVPEKKVIFSFRSIMTYPESRKFLHHFLENTIAVRGSGIEQSAHHLFSFWGAVNSMKQSERVKQIEVAHELITYTYFINSINGHTRIPKEVLKDMEQFILGNCGPEAFFQTQKVVYKILEERYYPRFIVSKDYDEMARKHRDTLEKISKETEDLLSPRKQESSNDATNVTSEEGQVSTPVREHVSLSEQSLVKLRESLSSKQDALIALTHSIGTSSQPPETTQKIIAKLEKEVEEIQDQILMREAHVARSQVWLQFLSQWRAEIYSIQADDVESVPVAAIIVHPGSLANDMRCDAWVIARSISEIIQLKRKLMRVKPSLSRIEIFRLKNAKETDLGLIKKAKESMNYFFDAVLTDEICMGSEEVYLFFNPSPESLRLPLSVVKSNKPHKQSSLPFASLFGFSSDSPSGTNRSTSDPGDSEQDLTRFFEELEGKDQMKDDIAEPLYALLKEVFDLEENVSWLRKSLIAFVQVSYGKTINKQIRETVSWLTGEAMIAFYLNTLKDSFWPKDPVSDSDQRSCLDKDKTYTLAKHKLLQNIPDFLVNLMGETSAKQGILKLFELAQNRNLNKQLLYGFIELFMFNFIPELKQMMHNNDYDSMLSAADNL